MRVTKSTSVVRVSQAAKSLKDRRDDQLVRAAAQQCPRLFTGQSVSPPSVAVRAGVSMLTHRPRPLRPRQSDDQHVRAYLWYMKHYMAAGDDGEERQRISLQMPHVEQAHRLYVAADVERRQILEARLLTGESSAEIAERFATDAKTVNYYEQLFFNVRDRMDCRDWIVKTILGSPQDRSPSRDGVLTVAQRGLAYKLFAYFGGPLVLDSLIGSLSPNWKPQQEEGTSAWFDDATRDIVRSRAAMAASVLSIDGDSIMRFLKTAPRETSAGSTAKGSSQMSASDREMILRELERLGVGPAKTAASS